MILAAQTDFIASINIEMCVLMETLYTGCTCTITEMECCPRCPDEGCMECRDVKRELEMKKGICVGFGRCPFFAGEKSDSGDKREDTSVVDWEEKKWLGYRLSCTGIW